VTDVDVRGAIEASRPAIERVCDEVWQFAETSFQEVKSSQQHRDELEAADVRMALAETSLRP
jgi:metal-dependent amidase/aminoacylase/carboxypeptidase family protein